MMLAQKLVSQSELARLANVPYPRLARAIKAGAIVPDARSCAGRLALFDLSRLDEIKTLLAVVQFETIAHRIANPVEFEA